LRVLMIDTANQTPSYDYPLCQALAAAGCTVELVTAPFTYGELPPVDVPVHETFGRIILAAPMRRSRQLRQVGRALEYPFDWARTLGRIRRYRPDVVHVQWAMVPQVDRLAFHAIRRTGARLVYTVHDIDGHYGYWRRRLLSTRSLYHLADDLIVHSEANKEALCAATSLPSTKIHVLRQGSLVDWSSPAVPRHVARQALGLPAEDAVLLFFGGVKPYKRLDFLIEAMPLILARRPTARLLIAGYPAEPFSRYQLAIDRLGIGDRVVKHLAYVPEKDVAHYFCAADLVALPYTDADFSGVLLLAYTYGRPVVATETGGLRELIEKHGSGRVVPPTDPQSFADAVIGLVDDPEGTARMGERARQVALTEHSWQSSVPAVVRIYEGRGSDGDRSE
jgi:D-inositol-3-phosphate glycosyltransferase